MYGVRKGWDKSMRENARTSRCRRECRVLSEESMLANTPHECNTVSPTSHQPYSKKALPKHPPSKKWSKHPYPGISSSGPTRTAAPRARVNGKAQHVGTTSGCDAGERRFPKSLGGGRGNGSTVESVLTGRSTTAGHEAQKIMVALLTGSHRKMKQVRSYPTKDRRTRRRAWSSCVGKGCKLL